MTTLALSSTGQRRASGPRHRIFVTASALCSDRQGGVRSGRPPSPAPKTSVRGVSRAAAIERITTILKALEAPLLVELAEVAQDFTPVPGAERRHELEIGGWAFGERRLERAVRALRHLRRMRHRELDAAALAEGLGAVEAALRAGAAALQRRIERDAAEARCHHEVAVGLEARGQRPVDLLVGEHVDVIVHHEHVLDVAGRAEHGSDGVARLARIAL